MMASQGLQILGVILAIVGWLGTIITCFLPMWKVNTFIGQNIVTAQVIWEGLWTKCVVHSTGQKQCKVYDYTLDFPEHLETARAMVIFSIIVGMFGVLIAMFGGKCTNGLEDKALKAKACIFSGVFFINASIITLVPVSWTAHNVIRDFYNPLLSKAQLRELGVSLYIGWGSAALLFLGGGLLCWNCGGPRLNIAAKFTPARSASSPINNV